MVNKQRKTKTAVSLMSVLSMSILLNYGAPTPAYAEGNIVTDMPAEKKLEDKAEKLLYQAPESIALTPKGEKELMKHYVEKYMPVEGCSLVEELPKSSDIHYVPPKPKPKTKVNPEKKPSQKEASINAPSNSKSITKASVSSIDKDKKNKRIATGQAISMSSEERVWLEKLVEAESGGEPYEGRLAVATIIANRVAMPEFPDTVMEVITAPKQFSPFMDGSIERKVASAETKRAVAEVFDKGVRTLPADASYFCTTAISSSSWIGKTRPFIKTIGNHSFYLK